MRQYFYWLYAIDPEDKKPILIFGCPARDGEQAARQKGLEMLNGIDFRIRRLPTRDLSTASAYIRGKRLEGGLGLHESARRQGHEKTLLQKRRRLQRRGQ